LADRGKDGRGVTGLAGVCCLFGDCAGLRERMMGEERILECVASVDKI